MYVKLLTAIAIAVATGMVMLTLRQQRIDAMHDMSRMHRQMTAARHEVWDLQTRIGEQFEPSRLEQALRVVAIEVESLTTPVESEATNSDMQLVRDHQR